MTDQKKAIVIRELAIAIVCTTANLSIINQVDKKSKPGWFARLMRLNSQCGIVMGNVVSLITILRAMESEGE